MMRQPPAAVPSPIATAHEMTTQVGTGNFAAGSQVPA
jgi:hypothetical protein